MVIRELSAGQRRTWLLVGTLPNAGSTALAQVLATAPGVRLLEPRGEGLRLCPEFDRGARWAPGQDWDYDRMARVWRRSAGPAPGVILDKSPPNLPRLARVAAALAPELVTTVALTRHPLAICASWARRMTPETVAAEWTGGAPVPQHDLLRHLADLCGAWMAHLAATANRADAVIAYETLCADPVAATAELRTAVPAMGSLDATGPLAVKDHARGPLQDMNAAQIAALSPEEVRILRDGLAAHADTIVRLGYAPDTP